MSQDIERNLPESVTNEPVSKEFRIAELPTVLKSKIRIPSKTTLAILGLSAITFLAVRDYSNLYTTASEAVDTENPGMSLQAIKELDGRFRSEWGEEDYQRYIGNKGLAMSLYVRDGFVKDEMERQFGSRKIIDEGIGKAGLVGLLSLTILKSLGFLSKQNNPAS